MRSAPLIGPNCLLPLDPRAATSAAPARARLRGWLGPLGLVLLVAAAYGQTLCFDFVWDDHVVVLSNAAFRGRAEWGEIFSSPTSAFLGLEDMPRADRLYRPVLALTVGVDRAIWGARAGGFHLTSVLAHLAVVLLLHRLALRITGSRGVAFLAASLMAIHPASVEAVAWVAARMDIFVALASAAIVLLLRDSLGPKGAWRALAALLCFALALGSKETAVVIPLIVSWAAWVQPQWFLGSSSPRSRGLRLAARVVPFWVGLCLYAALRQNIMGALAPVSIHWADLPAQMLRALAAAATYGEMTLIPRPTTGYVRVEPPTSLADGRVLLGLAFVGLLLAGLWGLRRRHPAAALALGWYTAALLPVSNVLPVYWKHEVQVAERYLYPSLVGWCLFLAVGLHGLRVALDTRSRRFRCLGTAMAGLVLGTFLVVTAAKVGAWRDDVMLWTAASAADPGSASARANLVLALAQAGDLEGAKAIAREASARFPADPRVTFAMASLAEMQGDRGEALHLYERAIDLGAHQERLFRQAVLLAARLQERERAGRLLALAAGRFPEAAWPQMGLGWYADRAGQGRVARSHFERAAQMAPASPERSWFLAQLLGAEGNIPEATQACQAALATDPSFVPARRALALIAEQRGDRHEAIGQWRHILESLPGNLRGEALAHLQRLTTDAGPRPPERP